MSVPFSKLSCMGDDVKAQGVRLLDVFVYGPFMIFAGLAAGPLGPLARAGLVALGVGTIAYNAGNYIKVEESRRLKGTN